MARKTAAQVERGAYRAKRRALVRKAEKKPPSGAAFKGARAAHIGYCTSECWHAQVQGQYTVEVKQKSASGGSRRPKPWAKYYILDRGNYAKETAIHVAGRSYMTSNMPKATQRAGFAGKVGAAEPALGGNPRYTVYTLKGCVWSGLKNSPAFKALLSSDSTALDRLAASLQM